MSIIILLFLIYLNNFEHILSQNNSTKYTKFINLVCNISNENYDECSCNLAQWNIENEPNNNLTCFNRFTCPYDIRENVFCSGHGICDFNIGECKCNREYGSFDCSKPFEQFLPAKWIMYVMIIIAIFVGILSLILMIWVHKYRDVGDVKAMSVVFTHLTLVGCVLICAGTVVVGLGFNENNCVILEWFHFVGICIVLACALLKSYRIASIFSSSNFSPSDLTDSVLLKYFFIIMIVNVLLLTLYTIFNFIDGGAYRRYIDNDLLIEERCNSEPLTMLSYSLLVAWQLVLLLFVIKYGNETRSAGKIFKETKCIYVGSNIGSICFIAFGIFVLFTTNYTLQIVIRGYGPLFVTAMVIYLLFFPKFKAVYELKLINKDNLQNGGLYEDEDGNKYTEDEINLKRQYEANVKDPNGKELLLLLDALVRELAYRTDMKMLSIELKSIDLLRCLKLLDDVKNLVPQPLQEEYYKQQQQQESSPNNNNESQPLQIKQGTIQSTSTGIMSDDAEEIKDEQNDEEDQERKQIPQATNITAPQKSKSKSSRNNRKDSLDSDSQNVQSDPEENVNDDDGRVNNNIVELEKLNNDGTND